MARAKNTDRAEARRRFREARAAELGVTRDADSVDDEDELDPVTGRRLTVETKVDEPTSRPWRRGFQMPTVRRDLADLPQLFRERRLLYLPFALLLVAFVLGILLTEGALGDGSTASQGVAVFVQFTLPPSALLVFFLGGFIAPRSSYLIGFLLGVLDGILYYALVVVATGVPAAAGAIPSGETGLEISATSVTVGFIYAVIIGTVGAAFAAWYRNFLRSSQDRAKSNRIQRDNQRRAAEKAEARAGKRPAKPASR